MDRNYLENQASILVNLYNSKKFDEAVQKGKILIKKFPKDLSVEDILIRSSNGGTILIARQVGEDKFKRFLENTNLLKSPELEIEEVGNPIDFSWDKCK